MDKKTFDEAVEAITGGQEVVLVNKYEQLWNVAVERIDTLEQELEEDDPAILIRRQFASFLSATGGDAEVAYKLLELTRNL